MDYTHIPDISCFYSEETSSDLLSSQAHFEYQLLLVTAGEASLFIQHRQYELGRGSLVFISSLERHSFVVRSKPYKRFVASISGELLLSRIKEDDLLSVFLQRPAGFSHVIQLSEEVLEAVQSHLKQLEKELGAQQPFHVSRSIALVQDILIDLYRAFPAAFPPGSHTRISGAVLNAQRFINEHYGQDITLQQIADAHFISRHTLSLAFKEIVGITFKDYLVIFRITEAKRLLLTTDDSVEQIAEKVGYWNVNNFIRIFKSREEITPLQYRKRYAHP